MTANPRWLNDQEQDFWRTYLAAMRKVDRGMDETLLLGSEISASEFAVLVTLSEAEDRCLRLRELCAQLDWDRSRTSHQVTRMERRGIVEKSKAKGDGRGIVVRLTDAGFERLKNAAPNHVESVRRLVFDHLDPADLPVLKKFFDGILAVDTVPGVPGFPGDDLLPASRS